MFRNASTSRAATSRCYPVPINEDIPCHHVLGASQQRCVRRHERTDWPNTSVYVCGASAQRSDAKCS
eukprot:10621364-Prorocentrum_lima.AAC.1